MRRNVLTSFLWLSMAGTSVLGGSPSVPRWDLYRLYLRGLLAQEEDRWPDAMAAYQEVLRNDPAAVLVNEDLTDAAMASGQSDVALSAARRYAEAASTDSGAHVLLGRVHSARGEIEAASAAYGQALRLDPSNREALSLAVALIQDKDVSSARGLYESFLLANPDDNDVRLRLADLLKRIGAGPEAEEAYRGVVARDPENLDARVALGELLEARGDTEGAVRCLEEVATEVPDRSEVLGHLGQLYYGQGKWAKALEVFSRAASIDPHQAGFHFWQGLSAQQAGRWEEAKDCFRRAADLSPDPGVLLRWAALCSAQGEQTEAIGLLQRLLRQDPANADFMHFLGLGYSQAGNDRLASRWFRRALQKKPTLSDAHFQLAMIDDKRGRWARAERRLSEAVKLDPDNPVLLNYLGYSWADRGRRLPEALALIQRAVDQDRDNLAYQDSLAWVYFRLGRTEEAESLFRVIASSSGDATVWSHYGDVLSALGRSSEAVRAWQEGLLCDPDERGLIDRLKKSDPARTLLMRLRGGQRDVVSLAGPVTLSAAGPARLGGFFYYHRAGLFRVDLPGVLLGPNATILYDGKNLEANGVPLSGMEEPLLALMADMLTGEAFRFFDSPSGESRLQGRVWVYRRDGRELRADVRNRRWVQATWKDREGNDVTVKFGPSRWVDGILWPTWAEVFSPSSPRGLRVRWARLRVNPRLPPDLFAPAP